MWSLRGLKMVRYIINYSVYYNGHANFQRPKIWSCRHLCTFTTTTASDCKQVLMGRAEAMAPSMESVKDVFITVITPVASFLDPHRTSLVDRCAGKTCMHHILVMKHWSTVCKHYQLSRWRGGEALIIMLDDTKKASCWHQTTWKPLVCKHWILTANLVSCFTLNVRWKLWQQLFNSKKKHYGRSNWDCTDGYLSLGWCFFHVGLYWHHWLYIKMDHIRAPQKWSQTFWLLWYGLKLLTLYQTNQTKNSKYT